VLPHYPDIRARNINHGIFALVAVVRLGRVLTLGTSHSDDRVKSQHGDAKWEISCGFYYEVSPYLVHDLPEGIAVFRSNKA